MSVEDYRDNFRYIHGNLTEWLPDGCRAVAADNRYSLARWAGAYWKVSAGMLLRAYAEEYAAPGEEDGAVSRIHISYEEPCTKRQLIEKAARSADESGLNPEDGDIHMYYPYPDMHLPLAIYSDKWLPHRGELTNNYRNFATDRLEMFDEAQTWDELIADGMFAEYSNSYLAVMSPGTSDKLPVFIKYSNDRAPQYRICTEIYDDADGRRIVKRPMTDAAAEHIAALAGNGSKLDERYKNYFAEKGVKVSANSCHMEGSNAVIEFLEYGTLESKLADFLAKGNVQAAMATVRTFADIVRYNSSYNVWDIDMIFKNIFVNDNLDEWIITDYEWTWQIDNADVRDIADYIIQRAVYYFIADNQGIQDGTDELYEAAGVTKPQLASHCYERDNEFERKFQEHVKSGHIGLNDIYSREHGIVFNAGGLAEEKIHRIKQDSIDAGADPCDIRITGELKELNIKTEGRKAVTVHPAHCCCFVYIKGTSVPCRISTNGMKINNRLYAFTGTQPEITFTMKDRTDELDIQMYVSNQGSGDSPAFAAAVRAYTWKRLFV